MSPGGQPQFTWKTPTPPTGPICQELVSVSPPHPPPRMHAYMDVDMHRPYVEVSRQPGGELVLSVYHVGMELKPGSKHVYILSRLKGPMIGGERGGWLIPNSTRDITLFGPVRTPMQASCRQPLTMKVNPGCTGPWPHSASATPVASPAVSRMLLATSAHPGSSDSPRCINLSGLQPHSLFYSNCGVGLFFPLL